MPENRSTDMAFSMTIDGCAVSGASTYEVMNPATGRCVARAPQYGREQVDDGAAAARAAFPAWAELTVEHRSRFLAAMADAVDPHADKLTDLVIHEQGKPGSAARQEVAGLPWWLR
ncbi:aldehyde dehydrogenase family protein [Streptomyces sp. NPDC048409]|uniref:aldehyde dehydrogenase family protein n=1 Tax=Streptomyces sp. NPDC048409 TaxID=3154723 RepID=UPI0034445398